MAQATQTQARSPGTANTPGVFDNYALVLSWSPDYCETNGYSDPQQCTSGKKLGFVLHGLWPQYVQGYPESCSTKPLLANVREQFPGLYPSSRLYGHEWQKHGTCSGLTPQGYFQLSQTLKRAVAIPKTYQRPEQPFRSTIAQLQRAFVQANDEFQAEDIAPYCSGAGRFLQEVFFCYDPAGNPQACSLEVRRRSQRSCGQADFLVRSVR
jgi:ribonuclease T2